MMNGYVIVEAVCKPAAGRAVAHPPRVHVTRGGRAGRAQ